MIDGLNRHGEVWQYCDDPPLVAWDERIVLGSSAFEEASDARRSGGRAAPVLLVGHSRDPDLARIATQVSQAGARPEVLLVDRVGRLPHLEFPSVGTPRRYDVGYCRGFRPEHYIHYHFNRTLRRDGDWHAIESSLADHATSQAESLLWNWLAAVMVSRWVNSPWRLREAENKLTQLACADQAGLTIPRTLVTNDIAKLRSFAEGCDSGVIHKSLSSPVVAMSDGSARFLYTSPIVPAEIDCLPYPCLFQERLLPRVEHRVTVIGRRVFTASLHRSPDQLSDWRRDAADHNRFEHHQLPDPLACTIHELMNALDIQIGAVDLIATGDQIYFLEINPSAALTWLERALGMHLCQSVTNLILCGA